MADPVTWGAILAKAGFATATTTVGTAGIITTYTIAWGKIAAFAAFQLGGVALAKRQQRELSRQSGQFRTQEIRPQFDPRAPMLAIGGKARVAGVYEHFGTYTNIGADDDVHDIAFRVVHAYSPNETAEIKGFWLGSAWYEYPGDFTAFQGPQEGEYAFGAGVKLRRPKIKGAPKRTDVQIRADNRGGIDYGRRADEQRAGWVTYMDPCPEGTKDFYGESLFIKAKSRTSNAFYRLPVSDNAKAAKVMSSAWNFRNTQDSIEILSREGGRALISSLIEEKHYDPRKDSTRTMAKDGFVGNGTQRIDDPSTFEPTDNPALLWLHYKLFLQNRPLAKERIAWKMVADAADKCDELVPIPDPETGAIGTATEKRYTCNIVWSLGGGVSDRQNIDATLNTCLGREVRNNGKWGIILPPAPADLVAQGTLTTLDFIGRRTYDSKRDERYGSVSGTFTDPDKNYDLVGFPDRRDPTEIARRGFEKNLNIDLRGCTTHTQCQRIANLMLKRSNGEQETFEAGAGWKALKYQPGGIIAVDHRKLWASPKNFFVEEMVINAPRNPVGLALTEVNSEVYQDLTRAQYHTYNRDGVLVPRLADVPPVKNLTATSDNRGGGILLRWDFPANWIDPQAARIYASRTANWADAELIIETPTDSYVHILEPGEKRWYWIRNYSDGKESIRTPNDDVFQHIGHVRLLQPVPFEKRHTARRLPNGRRRHWRRPHLRRDKQDTLPQGNLCVGRAGRSRTVRCAHAVSRTTARRCPRPP